MNIKIGQFAIRDWNQGDVVALAKHADNPKVASNLRDQFPSPYTLADAKEFLSIVTNEMPLTVFAIATEIELIGCIGLTLGQDIHRRTAELGYWLAEPYWGRGIMTAAVTSITHFGFQELGLNRIHAEPFEHNEASVRVLKKAGFEYEGRLRSSVVKDSKVLDQFVYSKIKDEET